MRSMSTMSTITEKGSFHAQSPPSRRGHSRVVPRAARPFGIRCGQGAPREPQDPFGDSQRSCRHQSGISPEMAIRLAIAFKTTPESWLAQQAQYDLWRANKAAQALEKKVKSLAAS